MFPSVRSFWNSNSLGNRRWELLEKAAGSPMTSLSVKMILGR